MQMRGQPTYEFVEECYLKFQTFLRASFWIDILYRLYIQELTFFNKQITRLLQELFFLIQY